MLRAMSVRKWSGASLGLCALGLLQGCSGPTRGVADGRNVHAHGSPSPAPSPDPSATPVQPSPSPSESPLAVLPSPDAGVPELSPSPSPSPSPSVAAGPLYRGKPLDETLKALAEKPVVRVGKRFNKTEPVYHIVLADGWEIAFKPSTRPRPGMWRNDVMAWEASRLLGFWERVPPATGRLIPLALLPSKPGDDLKPDPQHKDMVWGSAIYWMPVLERSHLAGEAGMKRWDGWLSQAVKPTVEWSAEAEQTSTLIVFDYLQGNIDRFDHPSNIQVDEHGVLVYRDNNEAWMSGGMKSLNVNKELLKMVQRFSRRTFEGLKQADSAALAAAVAPWESAGKPLIDPTHLEQYERRRRFVIGYIEGLISRYGEAKVLLWP